MAKYTDFQDYVLGQLESAGEIRARRMFGGVGVYVDEVFCAILSGSGRFYLRVDERNQPAFEERGMAPFKGRGESIMPYFEVPTEVLEDEGELASWVAEARAAGAAARPARRKSTRAR